MKYRILELWQQPLNCASSIPNHWADRGTHELPADISAKDIGEKFGDGKYLLLSGDFATPIEVASTKTYSYVAKES